MEESKTLFFSSKFPWARGQIFTELIDGFGKRPQKGSPTLP